MTYRTISRLLLAILVVGVTGRSALGSAISELITTDSTTVLDARLAHGSFSGGIDNHGGANSFGGLTNWSITYSLTTIETPPPSEHSFSGSVTIRHLVPALGPILIIPFNVPTPSVPSPGPNECFDIPLGPVSAAHGSDTDELTLNVHYCAIDHGGGPLWATPEITDIRIDIDGLHISSATTTTTMASTTSTSIATTTTSSSSSTSSSSTSSSTSSTSSSTSSSSSSTSSTSTSSSSSTSTSSSSTSSTSTSTSTSTTTSTVCDCANAFQARRRAKFNNDAEVRASISVNDPKGLLVLGRNVTMPDGVTVTADRVQIGNGSNIYGVVANGLRRGQDVTIRNGSGLITPPTPPLPLQGPFCTIPSFTCGGPNVIVSPGTTLGPLAPGTYGTVYVMNGGELTLSPGTFVFCNVLVSRYARLFTDGVTELDIAGGLKVDNGARMEPLGGTPTPVVNVAGALVRIGQGAFVQAAIHAPNATVTIGRGGELRGCFCAAQQRSDKHPTVECVASPSGAFLD